MTNGHLFRTSLIASILIGSSIGCQTGKLSKPKDPATIHYLDGVKALHNKEFGKAASELSHCVAIDPTRSECHWEFGWAYFMENRYQLALDQWQTVAQLQPDKKGLNPALKKVNAHISVMKQAAILKAQLKPLRPRKKKNAGNLLKIHAVGDTMLGTVFPDQELPPEGTSPLAQIKKALEGSDITFANYEGTLCDSGTSTKCEDSKGPCFAFRTPPSLAKLLPEAGFDTISLANNHIMDFDESCRDETERTLDAEHILWSGRTGTVAHFERKGVKFALIAFHTAPHCNFLNDLETAQALVRAEKTENQIVIVSFHGGAEGYEALHVPQHTEIFLGEDRGFVKSFSRKMVDAGADLVLGSGPHVLRAMEVYKNRLIAYSLGNFATYKAFNISGFAGIGMILEAEIDKSGKFVTGKIIPTHQIGFGTPIVDSQSTAVDLVRLLSKEDFPESGVLIQEDGTIRAPN